MVGVLCSLLVVVGCLLIVASRCLLCVPWSLFDFSLFVARMVSWLLPLVCGYMFVGVCCLFFVVSVFVVSHSLFVVCCVCCRL